MAPVVKNSPAFAGDIRDMDLIPRSGGRRQPAPLLAWRIPWTEETDGL